MPIESKKKWLIISFLIVLFSLIGIGIGKKPSQSGSPVSGGCVKVTVEYFDTCPRSDAHVQVTGETYLGITGEDGKVTNCDHGLSDDAYQIQATYLGTQFGPNTLLIVSGGSGSSTIINFSQYPQGNDPCGDSECDGFQYCVGDPKYIECDSWDTECDTKKCCWCDGGTQANPTENYNQFQDEDCPATICPDDGCGVDTCGPNIFGDYPYYIANGCLALDTCTEYSCNGTATCEEDADGDSYSPSCGDCNDTDSSINPGAAEVCDGIDNDCDLEIDEGVLLTFYQDADDDGYGDPEVWVQGCTAPPDYISDNTDCNDTDSSINPGAAEICYDQIDNDCDGLTDNDDPDCMPTTFSLYLSPNPAYPYNTVTAMVSGLSDYPGESVYVRVGTYRVFRCFCTVVDGGCSCTFQAPGSGSNTYYAQIDKNGDGDYYDEGEESEGVVLTIECQPKDEPCGSGYPPCCGGYSCRDGVCKIVGGCPTLKVYDGESFVTIEKLDIHAPEGVDTTYTSEFSMKPIDGQYKIILSEMWYALLEGSNIDSVRLIDEAGKECLLVSAVHSKDGGVLSQLKESDDVRVRTDPGEEITLTFEGCSGDKFEFSIEGYNTRPRYMKLALSSTGIVVILISVILVIVVVFGVFKFAMRRFYE